MHAEYELAIGGAGAHERVLEVSRLSIPVEDNDLVQSTEWVTDKLMDAPKNGSLISASARKKTRSSRGVSSGV